MRDYILALTDPYRPNHTIDDPWPHAPQLTRRQVLMLNSMESLKDLYCRIFLKEICNEKLNCRFRCIKTIIGVK